METFIRRYVHFRVAAQAVAVTLWVAHTYAVEQFEQSPLLAITSAVMRSGKTRLLDVIELLVLKPWRVVMPSDAVVYRYIEEKCPSLLLDEVDAIFGRKAEQYEGLRALLNAGNRKGTSVPRVVGQGSKLKVQEFSVYCAKALAGIGTVPATVARAIPIRLERRAQREEVARFRRADADAEAEPLREAIEGFMETLALSVARPEVPHDLDDRAAEGWRARMAAITAGASGTARLTGISLAARPSRHPWRRAGLPAWPRLASHARPVAGSCHLPLWCASAPAEIQWAGADALRAVRTSETRGRMIVVRGRLDWDASERAA